MNKKQYNNVVDYTVKHDQSAQTEASLATARAIFNNMGVALPQGDCKQVLETLSTNSYMGWRACTMQEAQQSADNGVAAIGISEERIVVLAAADEEQPVAQTASVMTLSENTSAYAVSGLQYYSYGYGSTTEPDTTTFQIEYGCGGTYRQVDTAEPNCFGYALFLDRSINPNSFFEPDSHITQDFAYKFKGAIECEGYDCRQISSYIDTIEATEYRIAIRCPNYLDGIHKYHVIYQLSDGTWAGKNHTDPSKHFGNKNPSVSPEMWEYDTYSPSAGTIYFAVRRRTQ